MIGLSAIPCSMDDDCCHEEEELVVRQDETLPQGESFSTHLETNNDTKKQSKTPCSPLFACSANHGFILPTLFVLEKKEIIAVRNIFNKLILDFKPSIFITSIWRPPLIIG